MECECTPTCPRRARLRKEGSRRERRRTSRNNRTEGTPSATGRTRHHHSGQASHHSYGRICRLRCAAAKQLSSIFDMGVSKMLDFLCKVKLTSRGDMEVQ